MANDRLRSAMTSAGLSVEELAREVEVDPKTVQRWLAGRVPHPRHRWALAEVVREQEDFLWPDARRAHANAVVAEAEIVSAAAYRADVDPSRWWSVISDATEQIDLLGYTLYFLPHQHPQFVDALMQKCDGGCKIRLVVADPGSEHVARRDIEEGEAITLVARIQSSMKAFAALQHPNVEFRFQDAPLYNSVFRFDDQMFVTPHLYATPGREAPLLHLRRLSTHGLFARFACHFEAIWDDSTPMVHDRKEPRAG